MMVVFVLILIIMMMVLVLFFLLLAHEFLKDLGLKVSLPLDSGKDLLSVKFCQRSRDDRGLGIVLAEDLHALCDLFVARLIGSCKNDRSGTLYLIHKELAEVLHIELALRGVYDRYRAVKRHIGTFRGIPDSLHNIRQLSYSGGFDQDPVGCVLIHDFPERGTEIPYQRTADAS